MRLGALAIIDPGAGIALAAFNFGLFARLRSDLKHGCTRVEGRLLSLEKEQARTSGFLEGLGLAGRANPAPSASD